MAPSKPSKSSKGSKAKKGGYGMLTHLLFGPLDHIKGRKNIAKSDLGKKGGSKGGKGGSKGGKGGSKDKKGGSKSKLGKSGGKSQAGPRKAGGKSQIGAGKGGGKSKLGPRKGGGKSQIGGGKSQIGGAKSQIGGGKSKIGGGKSKIGGGKSQIGGGKSKIAGGKSKIGSGKGGGKSKLGAGKGGGKSKLGAGKGGGKSKLGGGKGGGKSKIGGGKGGGGKGGDGKGAAGKAGAKQDGGKDAKKPGGGDAKGLGADSKAHGDDEKLKKDIKTRNFVYTTEDLIVRAGIFFSNEEREQLFGQPHVVAHAEQEFCKAAKAKKKLDDVQKELDKLKELANKKRKEREDALAAVNAGDMDVVKAGDKYLKVKALAMEKEALAKAVMEKMHCIDAQKKLAETERKAVEAEEKMRQEQIKAEAQKRYDLAKAAEELKRAHEHEIEAEKLAAEMAAQEAVSKYRLQREAQEAHLSYSEALMRDRLKKAQEMAEAAQREAGKAQEDLLKSQEKARGVLSSAHGALSSSGHGSTFDSLKKGGAGAGLAGSDSQANVIVTVTIERNPSREPSVNRLFLGDNPTVANIDVVQPTYSSIFRKMDVVHNPNVFAAIPVDNLNNELNSTGNLYSEHRNVTDSDVFTSQHVYEKTKRKKPIMFNFMLNLSKMRFTDIIGCFGFLWLLLILLIAVMHNTDILVQSSTKPTLKQRVITEVKRTSQSGCHGLLCLQGGSYHRTVLSAKIRHNNVCSDFFTYVCEKHYKHMGSKYPSSFQTSAMSILRKYQDNLPSRLFHSCLKNHFKGITFTLNTALPDFNFKEWPKKHVSSEVVLNVIRNVQNNWNLNPIIKLVQTKEIHLVKLGDKYFTKNDFYHQSFRLTIKKSISAILNEIGRSQSFKQSIYDSLKMMTLFLANCTAVHEQPQSLKSNFLPAYLQHLFSPVSKKIIRIHHPSCILHKVETMLKTNSAVVLDYVVFALIINLAPFMNENETDIRQLFALSFMSDARPSNLHRDYQCFALVAHLVPSCTNHVIAAHLHEEPGFYNARDQTDRAVSLLNSLIQPHFLKNTSTRVAVFSDYLNSTTDPFYRVCQTLPNNFKESDSAVETFRVAVHWLQGGMKRQQPQSVFSSILEYQIRYDEETGLIRVPQSITSHFSSGSETINMALLMSRLYPIVLQIIYELEKGQDAALYSSTSRIKCLVQEYRSTFVAKRQDDISRAGKSMLFNSLGIGKAYHDYATILSNRTDKSAGGERQFFIEMAASYCDDSYQTGYLSHRNQDLSYKDKINFALKHLTAFRRAFQCHYKTPACQVANSDINM